MPSSLLARVTLAAKSGIPRDATVNDWSFIETGTLSPLSFDAIATMLTAFYNGATSTGNGVHTFLSNFISRTTPVKIEIYNATGKEAGGPANPLGSPVAEREFALQSGFAGAKALPTEVALVLSMHANLTNVQQEAGDTRPAARRRGRVYLGPLSSVGLMNDDDNGRPDPGLVATVAEAMQSFNDFGAPVLAVWSRADAVFRPVVGGWIDNAFDTQRRRGEAPTTRTFWSAPA